MVDVVYVCVWFFRGVEMSDDADAAVENDKENAISHQMKIPHLQKRENIKWPLLKAHAK